ncbi:hypothetical protein [Desulfosporosinus sp. SB140]|uniref:hypothetical protein n=1 Tax=Desulfosporosinus paludis TaxID=3115649 RepID=UPI00388FD823
MRRLLMILFCSFVMILSGCGIITAPKDNASKGLTATRIIAASNSSDKSKASADYVCTGTNDEEQIRAAFSDILNLSNAWNQPNKSPILTGANFSLVWYDGTIYHAYGADSTYKNILHFTSKDGTTWTADIAHNPVLTVSGSGTWDNKSVAVFNPWKEGSNWFALYRGNGNNVCLATSSDGVVWAKSASNPVIANEADPAGIIKVGSTYYLYTNTTCGDRSINVWTSTNLTSWKRSLNGFTFTGDRYCSAPFKYNGNYYLLISKYYDARKGGVLELYQCVDPFFKEDQRKFLGVVVYDPIHLVDTPSVITNTINRDTFPNNQLLCYYSKYYPVGGISFPAFLCVGSDIGNAINNAILPRTGKVTLLEGNYNISHISGGYAFDVTYGNVLDGNNAIIKLMNGVNYSPATVGMIFVDNKSTIRDFKFDGNETNATGNQIGVFVSRGGLVENVEVTNSRIKYFPLISDSIIIGIKQRVAGFLKKSI